jgi:hypothetical protein
MKNAFVTFDLSNPQCVRVIYHAHEPTHAEIDEFVAFAAKVLQENRDFVIVSDVTKLKYLSSEHRIKLGNWIKSHHLLIKERCLGTVYVVSSAIGRMILNGIFLVNKPVIPRTLVASMAEADKWAAERLAEGKKK